MTGPRAAHLLASVVCWGGSFPSKLMYTAVDSMQAAAQELAVYMYQVTFNN